MINIHRNEKTHFYQPLTNSDISNSIDLDQESCCFENKDSILAHPFELDQHQNFENGVDILASYPFPEIGLKHEYDPGPQLCNSISLPDSIMTEVFLLDFRPFPKSTLNLLCQSIVKLNQNLL